MYPTRGYYSLLQFCPDASRLEAVNVGVILFCPDANFLDIKISRSNRRAEKLVGRGNLHASALNSAKRSVKQRLVVDRASFSTIDDLKRFISSRGNSLKLTESRPIKVQDPRLELEKLYNELVGGASGKGQRINERQLFPTLNATFERLQFEGRAELDIQVTVPVLDRSLRIPYAYKNGTLNLIKPHRFSQQKTQSIDAAARLAVDGDLIQRHGASSARNARFIIVSSFEEDSDEDMIRTVKSLFDEYQVKHVDRSEVEEFAKHVADEAHT